MKENAPKSQNPIERLVAALTRLPGIGEKTATRLAMFILRDTKGLASDLIDSLSFTLQKVRFCKNCQNLTEDEICVMCTNTNRHAKSVCVVQEPVDLMMIEKTGDYQGHYHVLHGAISPLDGIGPEEIRIQSLIDRVRAGGIEEIILATNPNPEGEATALYLKKILNEFPVRITRIASGVPVGGVVEYTDPKTLSRAMTQRHDF